MTLAVLGGLIVVVALIGGGVTIAGFSVSQFSPLQLVALSLVGLAFLVLGVQTERSERDRTDDRTPVRGDGSKLGLMSRSAAAGARALTAGARNRASTRRQLAAGARRSHDRLRTIEAAVLFLDVRGSSRIVEFVERHHTPEAAATLFMDFLAGCMDRVDGASVDWCAPSGDAVLATFVGPKRITEAVAAAWRAVEYIETEFGPRNQRLLSCNGRCGDRRCPRRLVFQVGGGIDDGRITVARLRRLGGREELVGSCVSFASKLSGHVMPPNSIWITERAYERITNPSGEPWRVENIKLDETSPALRVRIAPLPQPFVARSA